MRVGRPACLPYHARNVAEISLASVNIPSELRKVSARGVYHFLAAQYPVVFPETKPNYG